METREREEQQATGRESANGGNAQVQEVETGNGSSRNLRPLFYVLGTVALIAVLFWGIKYIIYAQAHETTDDAHVDASIVAVTSKIAERVNQIMVATDQPVKKGQLLIVLDSATERERLDQARADLQLALENQRAGVTQGAGGVTQAQAGVQNAQAQVPVSQAGVAQAQAQVQAALAAVPAARQALAEQNANLARTQALVQSGDLASEQLDAARAVYAQAQAQYRSALDGVRVARANLNAAQQRVGAAQSTVTAAQGSVQSAQGRLSQAQAPAQIAAQEAQVALAKQNLADTKIYSPINGYLGEKSVEIGQTVGAGTTLLTLVPDRVYITGYYKETQVGNMHAGQPVDIGVDAYKGVAFYGTVNSLNPASQNTYALVPSQNSTGNFVKVVQRIPVKIDFNPNTDFTRYPMRPGMSVEASVLVK